MDKDTVRLLPWYWVCVVGSEWQHVSTSPEAGHYITWPPAAPVSSMMMHTWNWQMRWNWITAVKCMWEEAEWGLFGHIWMKITSNKCLARMCCLGNNKIQLFISVHFPPFSFITLWSNFSLSFLQFYFENYKWKMYSLPEVFPIGLYYADVLSLYCSACHSTLFLCHSSPIWWPYPSCLSTLGFSYPSSFFFSQPIKPWFKPSCAVSLFPLRFDRSDMARPPAA